MYIKYINFLLILHIIFSHNYFQGGWVNTITRERVERTYTSVSNAVFHIDYLADLADLQFKFVDKRNTIRFITDHNAFLRINRTFIFHISQF